MAGDGMGTLHVAVGDRNQIKRIVKGMVLVNSIPALTEQHRAASGAIELFEEVLGDTGKNVRAGSGLPGFRLSRVRKWNGSRKFED